MQSPVKGVGRRDAAQGVRRPSESISRADFAAFPRVAFCR